MNILKTLDKISGFISKIRLKIISKKWKNISSSDFMDINENQPPEPVKIYALVTKKGEIKVLNKEEETDPIEVHKKAKRIITSKKKRKTSTKKKVTKQEYKDILDGKDE